MHTNLSFGTIFTKLLKITNVSNRNLAQAIDVNPSLISKWKNNTRLPSVTSDYLIPVSNFLVSNIVNEFQKREINVLADLLHISQNNNLNKLIYNILLKAKELHFKNEVSPEVHEKSDENTYKIITGYENIMKAGLDLLSLTLDQSPPSEEPIIMTFFNEFEGAHDYQTHRKLFERCHELYLQLMNKGHKVNFIFNFNDNLKRTYKLLSDVNFYYLNKNFNSFYIDSYDLSPTGPMDFVVIPSVGVYIYMRVDNDYRFDYAFFYKGKDAIDTYTKLINKLLINSTSLIETNKNMHTHTDTIRSIIEIEKKQGKSFLIKDFFHDITLPYEIYKKRIINNDKNFNEDINELLLLNKKRRDTFKDQLSKYDHFSIYRKDVIEKFVRDAAISDNKEVKIDAIEHIKHIIYLLETYNRFHIGILTAEQHKYINYLSFFIKDQQSSIVYFNKNNLPIVQKRTKDFEVYISEQNVINSLQNNFMNIWFNINSNYRSKDYIISWLKQQISILS